MDFTEYLLTDEGLRHIMCLLILGVVLCLAVGMFAAYCRRADERWRELHPDPFANQANPGHPDYWCDDAINRRIRRKDLRARP
ncbi:hypothetical protein [Paludibacterium sp.]|uniref:hypothetical protein n=1 Tax=Paludibacterium sp. TaxID=1917523 RepID=UPI0025F9991C|nr:hypothetical protein [Paludibacterium sp.]MBV8649699.1 hypothetical protein [Paludibacterium sp.]